MFDLRQSLAILIGKFILFFLEKVNFGGGTAAPGLLALKIDSQLLKKLSQNLKFSLVVSGTNGKTTTSRMLASVLKSAGIPYFHNRTGSNLLRGITSELIKWSSLRGNLENKIGLWEVDEAVLPEAISQLKPKIVILTNLFRDQLDRYGEIDTLAKKWKQALKGLAETATVIINSDDPTVASLGKDLKTQVIYYGIKDKSLGSQTLSHASDATACPYCLRPLKYLSCFVSHLGRYQCLSCGQIQPKTQIFCSEAVIEPENLKIKINGQLIKVKLSGIYNVYNVLASFATAKALKIDIKKVVEGFQNFQPAFGRFEAIQLAGGKNLKILLVKNPTGFNQVLKTLIRLAENKKVALLIALNDLIADGRDVSWIWDVDMEMLRQLHLEALIVSGTRGYDMGLRLKHANFQFPISNFQIEEKLKTAVEKIINQNNKDLYILPTYTAMLEIRKILNKMGLVHKTWED